MIADTPYLTADLPGIGGRIKEQLEDFEVEEIPAYEPSGSGSHLYVWIEKRDMGAEFFGRQIAQRLGVRPGDIGTAGMKDRRAVTRQWVSVPEQVEPRLGELDGDGIRVLKVSRHNNKLRPGHLRGNRFRVLVREPLTPGPAPARGEGRDATLDNALKILEVIQRSGLPNFYGPQRFGRDGETGRLGMEMLRGQSSARPSPFLRKLALSAGQSRLFNDYLARRMADGFLRTVLPGDVLGKWPAGGMFVSTDAAVDQPRFDAREVVSAGPMFGTRTFASAGVAAEREAAVLRDAELTVESFRGFGSLVEGTRRHNLIYIDELACAEEADALRLTFSLPSGSYATVLLREIMKLDLAGIQD